MSDHLNKQFADLFKGALPEQVQTMVQDGLAKSREITVKSISAAKDGAAMLGKSSPVANAEANELAAKAFDQVLENTEAAYAAAQSMVLAKSPIEMAQLQAKYMQAQFARAGEQTKALLDLSSKVAHKTAEGVSQMAAKSGVPFKA